MTYAKRWRDWARRIVKTVVPKESVYREPLERALEEHLALAHAEGVSDGMRMYASTEVVRPQARPRRKPVSP